ATRTIRGQASAIGWFYDPSQDFVVIEPGVWRAKVKILFDGRTSAGQVTEPFPTGDVLGSREGEFWFYVVGSRLAQLEIAGVGGPGAMARPPAILSEAKDPPNQGDSSPSAPLGMTTSATFVRPAEGPVTFTITPPPGLTNVEMHVTTTMPGFILEEKRQTSLTYTYDATKLAQDFPNLDLHDADGFAGADTITISFLVSGTDGSGAKKHHARQIVIQGEELQMPDQGPRPKRRAARR
ncbi:MAG TPA: hypothetical protein VMT00_07965, partial [Thermoanaerobaculia bacterium]|nr:hypothetical protein [Thermoanaerobaculia bacterium]